MKPARNDPCSCGSGKKFKHCCEGKVAPHSPMPSPDEINPLIALYNAGRYAELENLARILVDQYSGFGFGWKLLGGALQMQGKNALSAFQRAAELMPSEADAHYNLGVALKSSGLLADAAASYRRALKIKPDYVEAHSNLGNVLKDLGQLDKAVASYHRAVEFKPNFALAHNNLGMALQILGQYDAALDSYFRAVEIEPDFAEAQKNLGNAIFNTVQLVELESRANLLVERYPESGFASKLLGAILHRLGKDALPVLKKATKLLPNDAEAHYNLGVTQKSLGQLDGAVASYRRALKLKPDFVDAYNNLGHALQDLGQFDGAMVAYRRALKLNPDYAGAHYNLGNVLRDMGQLDDAVASCRRALELQPDYVEAQTNLLFSLNYTASHASSSCLAEAREYGRMVDKKVTARFSTWQYVAEPERLRVGIVSGDLHNHPISYALKNLLAQLDPARIELIAYSTNHKVDEFTGLIKPYFAAWKPLYSLSDANAARLIHADGVHVLLDLSGHTGHNRLPVFAWKPAPVQASWLGYFATTGVTEIDYLLTSEVAVPEAHREHFTETVWYLPDTWLCFTPPTLDLPIASLPALQNDYITFGCFQRLDKLGETVLTAWANIFTALPSARLRIACKQLGDPAVAAQFMERLQRLGIDPARVTIHGTATSREKYLARYAEVDVMLDSFPYPGVTTTCEALWMGVPTLTLAGNTLLARQGAGVLMAARMEDWIATSVADYIDKAVALTNDLPKLAAVRSRLREQVNASPLFDASRFARNFEAALWGMWQARAQPSLSKPHKLLA